MPCHTFAVLAYGTHGHPILSGRFQFHGGTIDATESILAYMLGQHFDQFDLQHLGTEHLAAEQISDRDYLKPCYQCGNLVPYLFDDARCSQCTRLTPEEVAGEVAAPVTPPLCPMGGTLSPKPGNF